MRGIRVAICFGTFPPERNGGSDFVARFADALAAAGCDVHVITSPAVGARELEQLPSGVTVHRFVNDWSWPGGRGGLRRLNALLRELDAELAHVFFPGLRDRSTVSTGCNDRSGSVAARLHLLESRPWPSVDSVDSFGCGRPARAQQGCVVARPLLSRRPSPAGTGHEAGALASGREQLRAGRAPARRRADQTGLLRPTGLHARCRHAVPGGCAARQARREARHARLRGSPGALRERPRVQETARAAR